MVRRSSWLLALLAVPALAAAAVAQPATTQHGVPRARLEPPRSLREVVPDPMVTLPPTLNLDRRSGFSYTHELQLGGQRLDLQASGPRPRTAARRRFWGLQLELRF